MQNVSMVNTVLATITADGFKLISDRVEAGEARERTTPPIPCPPPSYLLPIT